MVHVLLLPLIFGTTDFILLPCCNVIINYNLVHSPITTLPKIPDGGLLSQTVDQYHQLQYYENFNTDTNILILLC